MMCASLVNDNADECKYAQNDEDQMVCRGYYVLAKCRNLSGGEYQNCLKTTAIASKAPLACLDLEDEDIQNECVALASKDPEFCKQIVNDARKESCQKTLGVKTGLPWEPPSPNMPSRETATLYPGLCLVEATNLSEGRGTTRPFHLVGAPWLDSEGVVAKLRALGLPGVAFRAARFRPQFGKHAGAVSLIARNGRIVDWRAYGKRDLEADLAMERDTICRIYSMSKIVTSVVSRVNTVTGVRYRDDKTILAWETGNELNDIVAQVGIAFGWGAPRPVPQVEAAPPPPPPWSGVPTPPVSAAS